MVWFFNPGDGIKPIGYVNAIAGGVATFLVSAPVIGFAYRQRPIKKAHGPCLQSTSEIDQYPEQHEQPSRKSNDLIMKSARSYK
ncbi:unnamed protein product [Dovyalis caffra]|uniref:Uncharacterized protein n=1 Tax=Dovyalis caffra TaxID=77055 RepID=A0AAV1RPW1_9ROSI|nr:unnamed protein product [Dovyalis caffra]